MNRDSVSPCTTPAEKKVFLNNGSKTVLILLKCDNEHDIWSQMLNISLGLPMSEKKFYRLARMPFHDQTLQFDDTHIVL